jgi:hypothetical protein
VVGRNLNELYDELFSIFDRLLVSKIWFIKGILIGENQFLIRMSDTIQQSETDVATVECYLCNTPVPLDKSMKVPLTTGGTVQVHPSCMEFYLSQASSASACGSCTGEAGCC